jgi:hypothetical protein
MNATSSAALRFLRHLALALMLGLLPLLAAPARAADPESPGRTRNLAKLRQEGWRVELQTNHYACLHPDLKVPVTLSRAPVRHELLEGFNYLVTARGRIAAGQREAALDLLRETLREKAGTFLYDISAAGEVTITTAVSDTLLEWDELDFLFVTEAKTVANTLIRFRERARALETPAPPRPEPVAPKPAN